MIDPAEANQTYRAASAIGAFDAIQVAFAALVKKGILSKAEAEQILMQAIETIKTGSTDDQAVALLPSCRLKLGSLFQSDGEGEHGHLGDASHRHRNKLTISTATISGRSATGSVVDDRFARAANRQNYFFKGPTNILGALVRQ